MSEQLAYLAVLYKLLRQHLWKTLPVMYMELYHCEYSNCYLYGLHFVLQVSANTFFFLKNDTFPFNISAIVTLTT